MLRQRPPPTTLASTNDLHVQYDGERQKNPRDILLDEDDQTEVVELLRRKAHAQRLTLERCHGWIAVISAIVALMLPFLIETTTSSIALLHAVYTVSLILYVSRKSIAILLSSQPDSNSSALATTSAVPTTSFVRELVIFCLSCFPLVMQIASFSRLNDDGLTRSTPIDKQHASEAVFGLHQFLTALGLITLGGGWLIDYDAKSTERALKELESSKYRFKSI